MDETFGRHPPDARERLNAGLEAVAVAMPSRDTLTSGTRTNVEASMEDDLVVYYVSRLRWRTRVRSRVGVARKGSRRSHFKLPEGAAQLLLEFLPLKRL